MDHDFGLKRRIKDALRLYEGDTRVRAENGQLCPRQWADPFRKDEKAYQTLNALLFPGISNERARIFKENRQLNPVYVQRLEETLEVYCDIFRSMCWGREDRPEELVVRRVERMDSVELLKKGRTISFVSASKAPYSSSFSQKDGVALMEIHIKPDMPYVDFQKALGEEYARRDEKEVLLPPFVEISMEKVEMNKAEKKAVRDLKGSRPEEKYKVETKGFSCYSGETEEDELLRGRETAVEALKAMNRGEWQQDFSAYIAWKKQLKDYLENRFWRIWTSFPENHLQQLTGEKGSGADGQQVNADSKPDAKNQ